MHARHANGAPIQQQPYPGMQNARPPMQNAMTTGNQQGQLVPRHPAARGPPRPGMFPTAPATPAFKDLKPGQLLPVRTMSPGISAGRAGVGAGMGMAPRPQGESSLASLVGRGIDEAGYPMITGRSPQPGMAANQTQVYRPVPGMGPQGGVELRKQDNGTSSQGMVNRMDQLSVSRSQNLQPRPHLTPDQYPPQQGRSPPLSQSAVHSSRSTSLGGASISSTHSTSTTRTAGSSNESALNLRQHYVADPSVGGARGMGGSGAPSRSGTTHHPPSARQQQPDNHQRQVQQGPSPGPSRGQENTRAGSASGNDPMLDLSSSEQEYVEQLTCIVRKVAGAWSRTNLPPPPLDRMFRSIEGVYKVSKAFVQKLESLGALQPPPKAFTNLLVQWVEDLSVSYERYATIYLTSFNTYPAIVNNEKLAEILAKVSTTLRPVPPLDRWTIDTFFLLPYARLRYYRRLYQKLLDSGIEVGNDQRTLQDARDTLDRIISSVRERLDMDVNLVEKEGEESVFRRMKRDGSNPDHRPQQSTPTPGNSSIASAVPAITSNQNATSRDRGLSKLEEERRSVAKWEEQKRNDASAGQLRPVASSGGGDSETTCQSSTLSSKFIGGPTSPDIKVTPVSSSTREALRPVERPEKSPPTDLEVRLDTARAVDLFTMKPKMCKLQIAPPTLNFTRQVRRSADTTIRFTPTSTDHEVIHRRAHIFVLSDLFLMCERMSVTEKAEKAKEVLGQHPDRVGDGGPMPEMWLLYPPLAGRHLSVLSGGMENELIVTVMQRETFLLTFDDRQTREGSLADLQACIEFASSTNKPNTSGRSPISPQGETPLVNEPTGRPQQRIPSPRHASIPQSDSDVRNPRPDQAYHPSPRPGLGNAQHHGNASSSNGPYGTLMAPPSRNVSLPLSAGLSSQLGSNQMPRAADQQGQTRPYHQHLLPTHPSHYGAGPPRTASAPITQPEFHYDDTESRSNGPHRMQVPNPARPAPRPQTQPYRSRSSSDVEFRQRGIAGNLPHLSPIEKAHPNSGVFDEPDSPLEDQQQMQSGPAVISARMKCKVFLKHGHQQWKSLGPARLSLYVQRATNIKQLVVEADTKEKTMLISTIVLTDGVERVAKTGVAVEISDMKGARTGIIYMLQLRDEDSAGGLFSSLIFGSDRAKSMSMGGRKA